MAPVDPRVSRPLRGPARGAGAPARRSARAHVGTPSPRHRRAAAHRRRRSRARCPARAWARSCRWSGTRRPRRSCSISAPSRRGWRPSATMPRSRRDGPVARSSSRAARPMNSVLSHPTTQPSPAWSGVMPGPSSCPCSGNPASSRSVSRAPNPAGAIPCARTASQKSVGDVRRHGALDPVLSGVARARDQARHALPVERLDAEAVHGRRVRRHAGRVAPGPGAPGSRRWPVRSSRRGRRAPRPLGSCSTRWA